MNTDTLSLFEEDAGYFDPTAALDDLVQACKRDNIQIKFSSQVIDIKRIMSNVTGVTVLNKDSIKYDIDTSIIVNCAGPWYNEILNFANIKSPMNLIPTRIQVLYKNVDTDLIDPINNTSTIPITVDLKAGIDIFRPQQIRSNFIWFGIRRR